MPSGGNTQLAVSKQTDKETWGTDFIKLNHTSADLNLTDSKDKKGALTGNNFASGKFITEFNTDPSIALELSKESLPKILPFVGFVESNNPVEFTTTIDGTGTNTTTIITVKEFYGISEGDSIDVAGESDVVLEVDFMTKEVTLETGLTTAPSGDEVVTLTGKYKHELIMDKVISEYATLLLIHTDSNYHEKARGCKINSMSFEIAKKALITSSLEWIGIEGIEDPTLPAVTMNSLSVNDEDLMAYGTNIKIGDKNLSALIDSFKFTINQNLDNDNRGINHKSRRDVDSNGAKDITGDLEAKWTPADYLIFKGMIKDTKTEKPAFLELDEGVAIEFPNVDLTEAKKTVSGAEKIKMTANFEALWSETEGTVMKFFIVDDISTKY